MMSEALKNSIPPFPVSTGTAREWERWKRTLDFYFVAENINDAKQKQAKLIILGGKEIQDLYYSLPVVGVGEIPIGKDAYTYTLQCLDEKIRAKSTKWLERYILAQIRQGEEETATSFISRVRDQALKCEYAASHVDEAIQGQLINGCASSVMRMELINSEPTASLTEFENLMRTREIMKQLPVKAAASLSSSLAMDQENLEGSAQESECDDKTNARSGATFDFVIENPSCIENVVLSEPCMIRNLPWRIMVMPKYSKDANPIKSLGVFLECNGDSESSSWNCFARAQLILLSQQEGVEDFPRKIEHLFHYTENDWGFSQFMSWNAAMNPNRGFIKDDTIILRAVVDADAPYYD